MNLIEVEKRLMELGEKKKTEIDHHEITMEHISLQIELATRQKQILMTNFDLEKVEMAETILLIEGTPNNFNHRCVIEGIKDIVEDTQHMKSKYFGVKNFSSWTHQESDNPYGYGPSHGYIVFKVGLKSSFRDRSLTDTEKEACLYYLNKLLNDEDFRNALKRKEG